MPQTSAAFLFWTLVVAFIVHPEQSGLCRIDRHSKPSGAESQIAEVAAPIDRMLRRAGRRYTIVNDQDFSGELRR